MREDEAARTAFAHTYHGRWILAYTERAYAAPLPRHVVETFEQYLACGDLAHGFVRCPCDGCGHDVFVAVR